MLTLHTVSVLEGILINNYILYYETDFYRIYHILYNLLYIQSTDDINVHRYKKRS
jgi:hypothetical protein